MANGNLGIGPEQIRIIVNQATTRTSKTRPDHLSSFRSPVFLASAAE